MSNSNNTTNKLTSLGYEYDKENDIYKKYSDNEGKIEYQHDTEKLLIETKENNNLKSITYYINTQLIFLTNLAGKGELTVNLKYNVPLNKMECYKGNCENYRSDINHILKINREINTTLQ